MAVELAASGFEANPDALDAPLGYISSVVAANRMEGVDVGKATAELNQWHIADTWRLKKYPCGYIAQGAIDSALKSAHCNVAIAVFDCGGCKAAQITDSQHAEHAKHDRHGKPAQV